jgi:cyclopropane fatty-acyl-phospholipid synthase-like methyltransferase
MRNKPRKTQKSYTYQELQTMKHNEHRDAFQSYLRAKNHAIDKAKFIRKWMTLNDRDTVMECGSSSGKTSVDLAHHSGCRVIGIDFQDEAIAVSCAMRDKYFPKLKSRVEFLKGDLRNMRFDRKISKVLMPDFTEHVPDDILSEILQNIGKQLPHAILYVYTPDRSHIFEILRHRGILLKNPPGHVNVKSARELKEFLKRQNWEIQRYQWRPSHIPIVRIFEMALSYLPIIGKLFRRRIAIIARWKG